MQELNVTEMDAVSGGIVKVVFEGIISSLAFDILKSGAIYAMQNSHMGQGHFPPVPRAGRE